MVLCYPSQPTDLRLVLPKGLSIELSVAPLAPPVAVELGDALPAANQSSSASTQLPIRARSTMALSMEALCVAPPSVLSTLTPAVPALAPAPAQLVGLPLAEVSALPVLVTPRVSVIEMV